MPLVKWSEQSLKLLGNKNTITSNLYRVIGIEWKGEWGTGIANGLGVERAMAEIYFVIYGI